MKDVKIHIFNNLQDAWHGINEYLITQEKEIIQRGGGRYGPELLSYNNIIRSKSANIDPNFNFGFILGYKRKKWSSLINNYVDFNYLDLVKSEVLRREQKNARSYNLAYHFTNSHTSGKDCLISLNICRRLNSEKPIIIFHTRNSEVTKRLIFDFLLLQRISEYIFGHYNVDVEFYAPTIYVSAEHFTMYNNVKSIKHKLLNEKKMKLGSFQKRVLHVLNKYLKIDPTKITFRSHKRAANQIQRTEDGRPLSLSPDLFAYQLKLFNQEEIQYPKNCLTNKERKAFRRTLKR